MVRIFHNRSKCIGCNACVEANNNRWRISRRDGKSILVNGENINGIYRVDVGVDELQSNILASKSCPVKIIKVEKL